MNNEFDFLYDQKKYVEKICKTKYPVLLVNGVFFRDSAYFNYWRGRVLPLVCLERMQGDSVSVPQQEEYWR